MTYLTDSLNNIDRFLQEMSAYTDEKVIDKGLIVVPIKYDIFRDSEKLFTFRRQIYEPAIKSLGLDGIVKFMILPGVTKNPVILRIDLELFHVKLLEAYFNHYELEEISQSTKFLFDVCGWNDVKFIDHFKVSGMTLWRVKTGRTQQKPKATDTEPKQPSTTESSKNVEAKVA